MLFQILHLPTRFYHLLSVPLKGKGLIQVNGKECSNRLFATTPIKQPLVAKGVSAQSPKLQKVYEYDIETKAGKSYIVNTMKGKQ